MSSSHVQSRRDWIDAEVELLRQLVSKNPDSLKIERQDADSITIRLKVGSYVVEDTRSPLPSVANEHVVRMTFSDDYPDDSSLTIQVTPLLFHPGIFPDGRWQVPSVSHVVDYVYQLWEYYTYRHIGQETRNPQALRWYEAKHPPLLPNQELRPVHIASTSSKGQASDVQTNESSEHDQRSAGEDGERGEIGESESALPALQPVSRSIPQPIRVAGADGRRQSSGFRVKSPIRVTQPRQWRFPRAYWDDGTRMYYESWSYDVPHAHRAIERPGRLKVIILERALKSILRHASDDLGNERFGILVGGLFQDPQSEEKWVEIVAMLPAERVRANIASVEVSTEEINRLNNGVDVILAETQEAVRKIGWYHTHPGHGIFLSSTDQDNQRLCYGADWQVALVVDPIRKRYGAFYSSECTPLYDGLRVLSQQEAQDLQTPAYRAWRELEKHEVVGGRSGPPDRDREAADPPHVADDPQPVPVRAKAPVIARPPQTDMQREATPSYDERQQATLQQSDGQQEATVPQPLAIGIKILQKIGKPLPYPPFLALLLVLTLAIIFWLSFSLDRSNGVLADLESRSGQQLNTLQQRLKSAQQQLQTAQQQLNGQKRDNQNLQQQLQKIQQDLFNQVTSSDLKTTDPLVYRNLLKMVVAINSNTDSGKKATQALKEPLSYTVVAGDTLEGIAKEFGVSVQALRDANPGVNPELLQPGEVLKIPGITV